MELKKFTYGMKNVAWLDLNLMNILFFVFVFDAN